MIHLQYRTSTHKLDDVIDDEGHRLGHRPIGLKFNIQIKGLLWITLTSQERKEHLKNGSYLP